MGLYLIVGVVLGGLWLMSRQGQSLLMSQRDERGSSPSAAPTLSPFVATAGKGVGVLGLAQQAYGYAKKVYDAYQAGASLASVGAGAGIEAGTVTGDVLGTGALTATAPDILLPIGEEAVTGGAEAGAYVATEAGVEVAGTTVAEAAALVAPALTAIGGVFIVGKLAEVLINLGLNEYEPGSISRELMRRRQIAIFQQGNAFIEQAISAARDWPTAIDILAHAPAGTSGQIQFGVGQEYAGETLIGRAGTTETDQWAMIVGILRRPDVLRDHPEVIANFIGNLWVQLGPGGATVYDPGATLDWRARLLSKLPYHPEWNAIRQRILNMDPVDPRDIAARDAAIAALPEMPADEFLRVGWAKLPTSSRYGFYNVWAEPPRAEPSSVEITALQLAGVHPVQMPRDSNPTLQMINGKFISIYGWFDESALTVTPDGLFIGRVGAYLESTGPNAGQPPPFAPGWTQTHTLGYVIDPQYLDLFAVHTPIMDRLNREAVASAAYWANQAQATAIPQFGY